MLRQGRNVGLPQVLSVVTSAFAVIPLKQEDVYKYILHIMTTNKGFSFMKGLFQKIEVNYSLNLLKIKENPTVREE